MALLPVGITPVLCQSFCFDLVAQFEPYTLDDRSPGHDQRARRTDQSLKISSAGSPLPLSRVIVDGAGPRSFILLCRCGWQLMTLKGSRKKIHHAIQVDARMQNATLSHFAR